MAAPEATTLSYPVRGEFRRAGRCAFSMIELVMVLLVIGIAAAMVVPKLESTEASRLTSAANMLAADIDYARVESITNPDDTRLFIIDADHSGYTIAPSSDPTTTISHPVANGPFSIRFGSGHAAHLDGVTVMSYAFDGDRQLGYGIYGQPDQADPATVTLGSGDYRLTLTIDPTTGEPSIGPVVMAN